MQRQSNCVMHQYIYIYMATLHPGHIYIYIYRYRCPGCNVRVVNGNTPISQSASLQLQLQQLSWVSLPVVETRRGAFTFSSSEKTADRAQELCESRGGRPGLPVLNSPYGLCGGKATLNEENSCLCRHLSQTLPCLRVHSIH